MHLCGFIIEVIAHNSIQYRIIMRSSEQLLGHVTSPRKTGSSFFCSRLCSHSKHAEVLSRWFFLHVSCPQQAIFLIAMAVILVFGSAEVTATHKKSRKLNRWQIRFFLSAYG